jgi:hypothetical protein
MADASDGGDAAEAYRQKIDASRDKVFRFDIPQQRGV